MATPNKSKIDLSPREYMRARYPEQFSDSTAIDEPLLNRTQLEYHLSTITSRSQETPFEAFARRLLQKEICPNLIPHTGPTGGGDSKVDSETFPVAESLAFAWFQGQPGAADERWAFAFSAKKEWRAKVQSDVKKIAKTQRGYKKAFFVSSQYIPDKARADVEDKLRKACKLDVRILDRTWILDRVFDNKREQIAIDELGIQPTSQLTTRKGPNDVGREVDLEELEARITADVGDAKHHPGIVDDCLRAAKLSASLERPRIDTDGRFARALRMAERFGTKHQELEVNYHWAWRSYFWFEDAQACIQLYFTVESLAKGSDNVLELQLLGNLWSVLRGWSARTGASAKEWDHVATSKVLREENERLAKDEERPSTKLQAQEQLLILRLMLEGPTVLDAVAQGLIQVVQEAEHLIGFPMSVLVDLVSEIGETSFESDVFEKLVELVAETAAQRAGDVAGAKILLKRGSQQLKLRKPYEAIRAAGLALPKLHKHESRELMLRALWLCASAYEHVGLYWAARGANLFAANLASNEFRTMEEVTVEQLLCYRRLKWLELRPGRIAHALAWHQIDRMLGAALKARGAKVEVVDDGETHFDATLGILFLTCQPSALRECERMHDALEALGLVMAPMALVHALGHSNTDIEKSLAQRDPPATADEAFLLLRDQPASEDLPSSIESEDSTVSLHSRVLGCEVRIEAERDGSCVEIAETLVAGLEAFLATAFHLRITAHRPTLLVRVRRSVTSEGAFAFSKNDDEANRWDVTISKDLIPYATTQAQQAEIKDRLVDFLVNIFATTYVVSDKTSLEKLVGEERSLDRAINFANGLACVGSILGRSPKFFLSDWRGDTTLACKRSERWDSHLPNERKSQRVPGSTPSRDEEGRPNLDRVKHSDIRTSPVVDIAMWDEAQWRGAAFLMSRDGVPGLALLFDAPVVAERIFARWDKELGRDDPKGQLRVSVIRGFNKRRPHAYRIVIGSEPWNGAESKDGRDDRWRVAILASSIKEMDPDSSSGFDAFFGDYERAGKFVLIPARPTGDPDAPLEILEGSVAKDQLHVRQAWEIGVDDLDRSGIFAGDDPIIPKKETKPPIAALLEQLRAREAT